MTYLMVHEPLIRLAAFAGILALMVGLEAWLPRRPRSVGRQLRWPSNLGVVVLDSLLVRLVFPTAAVGLAIAVEGRGAGLLPWLGLPELAALPFAVVLLDLAIYLQHVMFHAVPVL